MLNEQVKLNPKNIRIKKDEYNNLFLENDSDTEGPIRVKQPFPLSNPDSYLVIEDDEGQFVGLIKGYTKMDPESRSIVDEELEYSYFLPKITQIEDIEEKFGLSIWKVETDRGFRTFEVKSRKRDIRWLSDTHIVIQDADGNKYEIPDLSKLDPESVNKLEMEV